MTKIKLCPVDDVAPDSAKRFDAEGHRIALVRLGDDYFAIGDRCSHADYSLAEGEIEPEDKTIECWKHGSMFSLVTGEPNSFPATKPVPVYNVEVIDGIIYAIATTPDSDQN